MEQNESRAVLDSPDSLVVTPIFELAYSSSDESDGSTSKGRRRFRARQRRMIMPPTGILVRDHHHEQQQHHHHHHSSRSRRSKDSRRRRRRHQQQLQHQKVLGNSRIPSILSSSNRVSSSARMTSIVDGMREISVSHSNFPTNASEVSSLSCVEVFSDDEDWLEVYTEDEDWSISSDSSSEEEYKNTPRD